jgi:hypothetical protein
LGTQVPIPGVNIDLSSVTLLVENARDLTSVSKGSATAPHPNEVEPFVVKLYGAFGGVNICIPAVGGP